MEPATFKYNERQISLKIDKATPKLIIRLLKVPGYNFALNSEEGDCIEPRGEEHFSEPLESGTLYTVLDLNDESDRPRSPQSAGEVTFVHQDESGRELVWKTNSQGLTFDRVASHFSVNVESMILVDNEGRPFEDGASLQLQNGMTYQVHGDPASHRRTSGAGNSQASSFHSNSRSQQSLTSHAFDFALAAAPLRSK